MLERGSRLGHYEIDSRLGRGGMGEVYLGRDVRLRRPVALKILAPALVRDRDAIARFRREAEAASSLNHPNILTVYDVGEAPLPAGGGDSLHFIAMEFVDGRTLREVMVGREPDPARLLEWMHQVASGLAKAHAAGVTHRDLKPENIMITSDGFAKILDFGLAKLADSAPADATDTRIHAAESHPGMLFGTPGYMSPEQAAGRAADYRSDVFALGCILYEIAAGHAPFHGDSVVDTLHSVIHDEPAPLSAATEPALQRLVRVCLRKRPEARYQSTVDLARDLGAIVGAARERRIPPRASFSSDSPGSRRHERSIAVLPFADLSPARDHDYIGDGLAEEIITDLSRLPALRVIARTSARQYRNTEKPTAEIARELDVRFVLTGSVRVAGDRLRISSQLVDAADDRNVWADRTDGTLDDLFDIQEKVARAVAEQLRVHLSTDESGALRERPIPNVHAFECYLKARRHIWEMTEPSLQQALADIDRAERLVGENPLLLASRAYAYWQFYNAGLRPDPEYLDKAEALVDRIVALDRGADHVNLLRGLIAFQRGDTVGGIGHLRRSVEEDRDADGLTWLIVALVLVGGSDEARPLAQRLRQLDPLSWMARIAPIAIELYAGEFDRALEYVGSLTPADLEVPIGALIVQQVYAQLGLLAEAAAVAGGMGDRHPDDLFSRTAQLFVDALAGRAEAVRSRLSDDLLASARADAQYSSWIAEVFALIGDADAALDWLSHAIDRGFINYPFFATHDRLLHRLRDDSRFTALMAELRVKWDAAHRSANL